MAPRFLISSLLVLILTTPASASFRITPEQPVASPTPATSEGNPQLQVVTSDGNQFLVLWNGAGGNGNLNATIVGPDGKVEAFPHVAIPTASSVRGVSACWTGSSYLVTWTDDIGPTLYAAAMSRDGVLLSQPHTVARATTVTGALASNGHRALVAFGAHAAVLAFDGSVVADFALPMDASDAAATPLVASDGTDFAVAWISGTPIVSALSSPPPPNPVIRHLYVQRLTESGTPVGDRIDLGTTNAVGPFGFTYGGGVYAIAAMDQTKVMSRYTIDPQSGTGVVLPAVAAGGYNASIAWNGSRFIAYSTDLETNHYDLVIVPFTGEPESAPPAPLIAASGAHRGGFSPTLAFSGRNGFGAWLEDSSDSNGGTSAILGQLFDLGMTAAASDRTLLSIAWSRQFMPSIATSGTDSLVAWLEERGSGLTNRILAERIAANGTVIDHTPVEIASGTGLGAPVVTFAGSVYVVAWSQPDYSILTRTVTHDGSLGTPVVMGKGVGISMASTPTTTLLVFSGGAVRLDRDGKLIDATPLQLGAVGYDAKVATNGTDFLVAWNVGSDYWQFPTPNAVDVIGQRVMADGSVDAATIDIATGAPDQMLRAVGSDGRDYLVVYSYQAGNAPILAAKRVLREGTLDGATPTDIGTVVSTDPPGWASIAHDASGYWITWFAASGVFYPAKLAQTDNGGHPGDTMQLMSDNTPMAPIALAVAPGGILEIAYTRRTDDGTKRAFLRSAGQFGGRSRAVRR